MTFLIADTFTDSLARLTGDEQKAAKTTAFDLQMDPSAPGLSFHKLDKAKDKRFWSVRVNADIRLIVHKNRCQPPPLLRRSSRLALMHGLSVASWKLIPRPALRQIIVLRESVREDRRPPCTFRRLRRRNR